MFYIKNFAQRALQNGFWQAFLHSHMEWVGEQGKRVSSPEI